MKKAILTILFLGILSVASAQSYELYEAHLQAGIEFLNKGNVRDALASFKEAKREAPTPDKEKIANQYITRCTTKTIATAPKQESEQGEPQEEKRELSIDVGSFSLSNEGGKAFVSVSATHTWYISHQPDWCNCFPVNSYIEVDCKKNTTTLSRADSIVVTMDEQSKTIYITQDAGLGELFFQTTPEKVNIRFLDKYISAESADSKRYRLAPDTYRVEISKGGYATVDTLITIPEQASDNPTIVYVSLPKAFGSIKLNIEAQKGYSFSSWPTMRIGNKDIDLSSIFHNKKQLSFSSPDDIQHYNLYEGNLIPVHSDSIHTITIKADGFSDYSTTCAVSKGNILDLNVIMEPVSGFLTLIDQGNAMGAKIIIDNMDTGHKVPKTISLGVGKHWVKFQKENMISTRDSIQVVIEEGKEVVEKVAMNFFVKSKIASSPAGAQVFIDDKPIGFTRSNGDTLMISLTEGIHAITVQKEGYLVVKEDLIISREGCDVFNYNLEEIHPIYVSADIDNLLMTLKKDDKVIIEETLPAEINIPYGKYKMKVVRPNGKTAYKGTLKHTGAKKQKKILSYSRLNSFLLTGTYFVTPAPLMSHVDGRNASAYKLLANAGIGNIKIAPGLSTLVVRGSMFTRNKNDLSRFNNSDIAYPDYLFGLSCMFINGEFRLGGAIHNNFDLNLLGSYAWMPNLTKVLTFSHASGHEGFVGLELSTRIPVFNASLRLGWEIFRGEHNIYQKGNSFHTTSMSTNQFVMSVAASLGGKDSKGVNVLRIW